MSNLPSNPEEPRDPFGPDPARQIPPQPVQPAERESSRTPWVAGVILIVLGAIFLLQNFGLTMINNWWALFILIPAVGAFASAWRMYQSSGRQVTSQVRGSLVGGLVLSLVAAAFLFDLDWGMIWPIFLIIIGVGALFAGLMRQ